MQSPREKEGKFLWWTYHKPYAGSPIRYEHTMAIFIFQLKKKYIYYHQGVWQIFIHLQLNGTRGVKMESSIHRHRGIHTAQRMLLGV